MTELKKTLLQAVVEAIRESNCGGREGPFGLYDYTHKDKTTGAIIPRHVIRDFRTLRDGQYGKFLHEGTDATVMRALYDQMTEEHVAAAAIKAVIGWTSGELDDAMACHYPLPDVL